MKYIYVLFLLVSFANQAESNLSYRLKYTALEADTELNYQSQVDLYVGDFLLSEGNTQSQKMTLNESLSVIELGTSYNWGYLILSADYAFNFSGDEIQEGKQELYQEPLDASIFGDEQLVFDTSLLVNEVEYKSGQVSIGLGNGYINVFGGYKIDKQISTMQISSTILDYEFSETTQSIAVLDSVIKGPFAGVSVLFDVTANSYIAVKLAATQYESGYLMLSNNDTNFNEPLTGKAFSFSTKWTGKNFFIGVQSKFYKSDAHDQLSVERTEIGLDIGIHFL
jgi:hypothetical protein